VRALAALTLTLALGLVPLACTESIAVPPDQQAAPLPLALPVEDPPPLVALGRLLFWDPILSGDRDVACASCHHPDFGYADGLARSVGVGGRGIGPARARSDAEASRTRRNSMTVVNVGWNGLTLKGAPALADAPMFWDNRVRSLELQALEPVLSDVEMRGPNFAKAEILDEVVARLRGNAEYRARFAAVFAAAPLDAGQLGRALAAFERSLTVGDASIDRYLRGDDGALSAAAQRGYFAFVRAGCAGCHNGPMFSDFALHRMSVGDGAVTPHDPGDGDDHFRTPSLRMVSRTGPYMHNGRLRTLEDVFSFYDEEVDRAGDPLLGAVEPPFGSARDDVRAFFAALSDGSLDVQIPARVPSGLPPGGS
jgi:cytochrome c peroxidase